MDYKIGDIKKFQYTDAPVAKKKQYPIGRTVDVLQDGKLVAKYIVLATDDTTITGKIITTYGHKRRNQQRAKIGA